GRSILNQGDQAAWRLSSYHVITCDETRCFEMPCAIAGQRVRNMIGFVRLPSAWVVSGLPTLHACRCAASSQQKLFVWRGARAHGCWARVNSVRWAATSDRGHLHTALELLRNRKTNWTCEVILTVLQRDRPPSNLQLPDRRRDWDSLGEPSARWLRKMSLG